jgi:hypothetical protein
VLLTYVILWIIVALLVREERPVGDRQYWLARPITWRQILISKALFVFVFIVVPLFVGHVAVLYRLGFHVTDVLPDLLMKEALFAAYTVIPAAALASITRNMAQMALATAVVLLVDGACSLFRDSLDLFFRWGDFRLALDVLRFVVLMLGALLILLIQFTRRRTNLSRIAAVVTLAAVETMLLWLMPGSWAFSIMKLVSWQKVDSSVAQLILDTNKSPNSTDAGMNANHDASVRIPIRVMGVPSGMGVQRLAWQYTVSAEDAGEWRSKWLIDDNIDGILGPYRSYFILEIDKAFYERAKDSPVRITGFFDMTLVEHRRIKLHNRDYIPGVGVCRQEANKECNSPWHCAALTTLPSLGDDLSPVRWNCGLYGPPIPEDAPSLDNPPPTPDDAYPISYFGRGEMRRFFTFNNVHLRDYWDNR